MPVPLLPPNDEHHQRLLANVRPVEWINPIPASRYNLVVIGGGTAGLVTAAGAAGLGARVALIEKHWLGGDCLNVGCVPSKTLIRSAEAAHEARQAARFGVEVSGVRIDFPAVMARVRAVRASLSPHDSAQRFTELGVDVFLGTARFAGSEIVEVNGTRLRFKHAVLATGARAAWPDVAGLREVGFLTNETIFNLTALPPRLAIIGGGPIGCEMAQAFQRLGASVTLFHRKRQLLDREDPDAAAVLQEQFKSEGIQFVLESNVSRVESGSEGKVITFTNGSVRGRAVVDEILVSAGRVPNVEGLNLEAAGVAVNAMGGVQVDDFLRTTNPRIYGAGDVCLKWKFTHAADFAARVVIQNALFHGRKRSSALTMPWATYTDPEIAHVGISAQEANQRGLAIDTYFQPFDGVDRAATAGNVEGFVKIHVRKGSDEILGATIVGAHAGELISEVSVAMAAGLGLGRIANVIHPYPTLAEAIRKCGDSYNRTRLTPAVKKWFGRWFDWTR